MVIFKDPLANKKGMSVLCGFLLLGLAMASSSIHDAMVLGPGPGLMAHQKSTPKCRYSRVHGMLQVRCWKMDLQEIPRDLKSDIQVLDMSMNRVRDIHNDSLSYYKSLAYLDLSDNFVASIDENAFANQAYLEVIDMTKNGCDNLPKGLFRLPYLRKILLEQNKLRETVFDVEVTSPLSYLQLCNNKLEQIPNLGILPTLLYLNVSQNSIRTITTEDLAPYCSLKILDLSRNPLTFNAEQCGCRVFGSWLDEHGIALKSKLDCDKEETDERCEPILQDTNKFSNRTHELFEECASAIRAKAETEKARSTWILVASCVTAFIVCVFVALFCVHKRNKKRRRKLKAQQSLAANNANTELLNGNLQSCAT